VLTASFTPKEPHAELLEKIFQDNVIVTFINSPGKNFICCKIIEHYINLADEDQHVLFLETGASAVSQQASNIRRLTCCSVAEIYSKPVVEKLQGKVVVSTYAHALQLESEEVINFNNVILLILNNCHQRYADPSIDEVGYRYKLNVGI